MPDSAASGPEKVVAKPRAECKKPGPKPKPKADKNADAAPTGKIVLADVPNAGGQGAGSAGESEWNKQSTGPNAFKARQMPMLVTDKYEPTPIPRLREFDPTQMKLDGTVIAIGKRRTGKSFLFRHILHALMDGFEAGICISQTDELNKYWRQYMPERYIFNKFSPEILLAVFARQKAIMNDKRYDGKEEEREKKARFFIILDDVISDTSIRYDPTIAELFVAGRHYKLFVLITTQYAKAITPTLRSNADYVFILNNKQEGQREALWRDFCDFMTKEGFYTLMDAYTEDNHILVVDTSEPTAKPWEILHWFKASDPGKFSLGNAEYWLSAIQGKTIPRANTDMPAPPKLVFPGDRPTR
jgi:hypothetical protein